MAVAAAARSELLTLEGTVPWMLRRGLLATEHVVDADLKVQDRARRNRNFKVVVPGGPGLLVKQAGSPADPAMRRTMEAESALLAAVARDERLAPIRWCSPRFVHWDADDLVLVTELVHPATSYTKDHLNLGKVHFPLDSAETAARILAAFHTATREAALAGALDFVPRAPPYAWTFLDTATAAGRDAGAALARFAARVRAEATFWSRIPDLRARWDEADGVVHGDARWDNFLLTHGDAPGDNLNVRLIDWELASRGDPAWDVAFYLTEYARFWLSAVSLRRPDGLATAEAKAVYPWTDHHASARAFWSTYAAERGLDGAERRATLARVLDYLPFTFVVVGFETLQRQTTVPGVSHAALDLAKLAADDPAGFARTRLGLEEALA